MSFFLVQVDRDNDGNLIDVPISDYGPYDKGSDAAKYAKYLTEATGKKVQPRRISQAADWRSRQKQRLEDGTLTPLPKKWDLAPIEDHFAHLDEKFPGKICFTENDQFGVIDRVTVLSPGRYISRFYETNDQKMDDAERRRLIALIDPSGEVLFARTPEEITRIYKDGPSSCMDGTHSSFNNLPVWPTAVYGAGDLAVAYTVNSRGRIQARALCWPEKKQFGRVYGDSARLRQSLIEDGFANLRSDDDKSRDKFDGARILKVFHEDRAVMAYFDDIEMVVDRGDYFVTALEEPEDRADIVPIGNTFGLSLVHKWCPKIKEYRGRDKNGFKFVSGVNEEWSSLAITLHAFTCPKTGKIWPKEFGVESGGVWISKQWLDENPDHKPAVTSTDDELLPKFNHVNIQVARIQPNGTYAFQTLEILEGNLV